jgi:MFS family permease
LVGVFLVFAFFIGFLAYMEQVAMQARLTSQQAGLAIALALATSILGSGAAAILAKRLSYYAVFLVCLPVNLGVVLIAASLPHLGVFIALSAVYGFFWGFFMPFQAPFVIESDPSRRAVLLIPGVQSIGAAGGPLLCSFFVSSHEARGALIAASACLLLAFGLATGLHILRLTRRGDAPKRAGVVAKNDEVVI